MITTYQEARVYLEDLIKPIPYKKVEDTVSSYNPLDRMRTILQLLGNPEKKFRSVQVSGTSGKGSTAYLLSHIVTAAGYKTGFTLSPHLMSITERFQINEKTISEKEFVLLVNELIPVITQMKDMAVGEPTYFEALMALTFLYFAREKVDIAVVEVGLEGRYDGTNTLDPLLFVLTNISLDHVEYLGDTVGKIASEAIGAIENKKVADRSQQIEGVKTPVVITGVTQQEVQEIVKDVCHKEEVPLRLLGKQFSSQVKQVTDTGVVFEYGREDFYLRDLFVSLVGEYQAINATLAVEAIFALKQFGISVTEEIIRESLKTAHFPGRFEKVTIGGYSGLTAPIKSGSLIDSGEVDASQNDEREIILDGAHNPAKMEAFVHSLEKIYPGEKYIVIIACKKHKDITEMLKRLSPVVDTLIVTRYYTTTEAAKNSSMSVSDVLSQVDSSAAFKKVLSAETIADAVKVALKEAKQNYHKIVITGSLYLVGEMKMFLNEQEELGVQS